MKKFTIAFMDNSTTTVAADTYDISNNILTLEKNDEPIFVTQMGLVKYLHIGG